MGTRYTELAYVESRVIDVTILYVKIGMSIKMYSIKFNVNYMVISHYQ